MIEISFHSLQLQVVDFECRAHDELAKVAFSSYLHFYFYFLRDIVKM